MAKRVLIHSLSEPVAGMYVTLPQTSRPGVLIHSLSEPLAGVTTAKIDINADSGGLTVDGLGDRDLLANGTLEYVEKQGVPTHAVTTSNGQTTLAVRSDSRVRWLRLPWAACNGATEWQVHLNPSVQADITARSGGGNVKLDLAGMAITHVSADTGGGDVALILPDPVGDLCITAKTGAGDVDVVIPSGVAARIHARARMGKVMVDQRFSRNDSDIYQSPDFDSAAHRAEITVTSGAGNVSVRSR